MLNRNDNSAAFIERTGILLRTLVDSTTMLVMILTENIFESRPHSCLQANDWETCATNQHALSKVNVTAAS